MSTTNTWASASLSTTGSIARWEKDINQLSYDGSGSDWIDKIDAAKELLGDTLEIYLKTQGITVDESDGEILLDVINNPDAFSVTSDYLTLALIYEDLSQGNYDTLYGQKSKIYWDKYYKKYSEDTNRINYDLNLDNTVDAYSPAARSVWLQR